jgi:hypothetical protein
MADFPLPSKQDSAQYGFEQEDVTIRSEMEGGYVLTRKRHNRDPRRTWKTGFIDLSDSEKATFESFFVTYGCFQSFTYQLPTTMTVVTVRFKQVPKYEYKGFGTNLRWNISDIILEEV